ncbi:MAG: ATP synthase F1 subunit gamma [Patescibacteria group bacterium]|nr:ATP synthase F1 subunit gamma [Patescibacteria group bacterium]MDE1944313.1 ATP synthase F1 subunit gamma [Patescibacteria group bacterium]MDE1945102.1 ATP synthase F1 subunit gamma [Patescibacteria group bacterium]MDE2057612.1 ATP synthase F1 subunit gamma [Patescibacteria group bacterium]
MALKDIKAKIGATNRTHKVTRAMEAVSAAKMRRTVGSALAGRAYARAALGILARLAASSDLSRHPLLRTTTAEVRLLQDGRSPTSAGKIALLVITSDKGLAGALNSGVIKAASEALAAYPQSAVTVYAYGKKGNDFFARRGYAVPFYAENKKDEVERSVMEELAADLAARFVAGDVDQVLVAYSNFKSTFEQRPTVRTLLPLSVEHVRELVEDIVPEKGAQSHVGGPTSHMGNGPAYTIEPADADVLSSLLPRLVAVSLYHMLLEAKASEHSARMVAMKSASDKSKEVAHALTRLANKLRQAAITREVSEIVGGREALAA